MSLNTLGQGGKPAVAARLVTGLTALGSTQATAFGLANQARYEFTSVPYGSGAILPSPEFPTEVAIFNADTNSLSLYPNLGGTINAGSVNVPISLSPGTGITLWASSLLTWYTTSTGVAGSSSGTVTSVATGAGLTGGTITTAGTVAIAAGGVGTTQLATSGVTYAKVQNVGAVSLLGNPTGSPGAPTEITLGANLSFSGSELVAAGGGGGGSGTVTSVATGTGLTGGPFTTSGTVAIAAGGVGTTQFATSGVTYAKVQNVGAVSLLGNPTGSPGAPSEITLGANL